MKKAIYLSIQYMKKQKGRTFALITGISLAVMLVFSLNVIPETKSKLDIQKAYETFEDYHVEYSDLDKTTLDKLKKDKEVTKMESIVNLGDAIYKNGVAMGLNSYNDGFNDEFGYKFVKGDAPKNKNEIVLEEKALKSMGLSDKLGQSIDLNIEKEYKDKSNSSQIFNNKATFKLVGIVKKPNDYYKENEYYKVRAFTYYKEGEGSFIPNELIKYNGVLNLNTKTPDFAKIQGIAAKYNIDESSFNPNVFLVYALDDYKMSKETNFSINNKLLPMIASVLLIYNVFNMILVDMTNQIGMLKAIGASKKHIRLIIGFQSFVVLILGSLIGFILGIICSYIGLMGVFNDKVSLYISKSSILEPMIMAIITVILASIVPIYKSGKISPIEAIRKTDKNTKRRKNRFYHKMIRKIFGISGEMAYKNVWRNKTRTILSILAISLGGALYIDKMSVYNSPSDNIDSTALSIMSMGNSDINLSHNSMNTENLLVGYEQKYIDEISKIKNVKNVSLSMDTYGFLETNALNLDKKYIDAQRIKAKDNNIETDLCVQGYGKNEFKDIDSYLEKGSLPNKNQQYKEAVIYNNFYYINEADHDNKILKKANIGDLIDIKIPVIKDGKKVYQKNTVKVCGILNKDFGKDRPGGYGGTFKVILNEDEFKDITNRNSYNNISLQIEKDSDKQVQKDLEKILKDKPFSEIESKYKNRMFYTDQDVKLKKEILLVVTLIAIISSINIFCTIKTNLLIRINELSTLRSIGMSIKQVKSMIVKESLIYGITSMIIGGIVGTYKYYDYVSMVNNIYKEGLQMDSVIKFNIPIVEILEYGAVCILICIIAVYLSKRKIEKLSISQGLRITD
ncbi:FtsX-like permease family protein [Romboutsia sedimentorum]|uniref:FtsX-like permease family protein n=1 Tax=Romboutsia sedimentorum TaxID=1368474 RepID=A0ABT7E7N6_9FIRM|nr:FtsX-like permease family protein [Romboutsia sedimentorum]MDK2562916.1 FtsX-like permease family protein [Romboutsia sedimentorum]